MLKIVFLPKATLYEMFKVTIIKSSELKYPFCLKKKKKASSSISTAEYQHRHNSEFDSYTLGTTV